MRANGCLRIVAAGLLLAVIGASPARSATPAPAASPAPAAAPPAVLTDPEAIFGAARKAWGAGAYPRYAQYAVVLTFHNGARRVQRTWDTSEDLRGGLVYSRAFSREELANPYTPHGVNVMIPFVGNLNKEPHPDPVGQVQFAVDQDYGIAPGARKFTAVKEGRAIGSDSSHLAVIGRTATVRRDYAVTLLETLSDEKGPEYHLGLKPLRNAWHHRLRELWVDGATMLPEEAVVEGIGNRAPLTTVNWRIEFTQVQGGTYIARETALGPVDYFGEGKLTDFRISFHELRLASHARADFGFGVVGGKTQSEPGS